ncbi:MAG: sulfatase [Thermoleophilaceae bacterium]|nr:sulfatase [Thermoleophilaceae bacterium]
MPISRRFSPARLSCVVLLALLAAPGAAFAKPPNVLVVTTDDQTVSQMDVMSRTNRLLGRDGTTFANAFVAFPQCCPSRASFLSGQYPHNHGVAERFEREVDNYRAFNARESLPVWLGRAGYATAQVGRYLNGYGRGDGRTEIPLGWDSWVAPVDHTEFKYYDYTLNVNGRLVDYGSAARDYQTDVIADFAVDYVDERARKGRPFFLNVSPVAPHRERGRECDVKRTPRPAPRHTNLFEDRAFPRTPSFNEQDMSDKPAIYRAREEVSEQCIDKGWQSELESLQAVDELVGRMVRSLRRAGEFEETLFVFTSDNGLMHGEHRLPFLKRVPYEEAIRVPLIVSGPGFESGTRNEMVSNIDLAPTILEQARARAGRGHVLDGRPLGSTPFRSELLVEERGWSALRSPTGIFVQYKTGERELYDLVGDPFQTSSLHEDPMLAPLVSELSDRLAEIEDCRGAECP